MEEQTLHCHREEHWRPRFLNRDNPETWMKKGSESYGERVTQKAIEILQTHQPEKLPDRVLRTIDAIVEEAGGSLVDKHFST
jgi:trimethylamine--corrinoid protein Co-methyltransferase